MGVGDQSGTVQIEFSFVVHVGFVHLYCRHLSQEHMMAAQFLNTFNLTFNINRSFFDHRRILQRRCTALCQPAFFPLVHIPAGTHTTIICGVGKFLRCQVNDELSALFYHVIRISLRTDRYICHGRIRTHSPCPRDGQNIAVALFVRCTHHNSGQRIDHISRFPCLFCHTILLLLQRTDQSGYELFLPRYYSFKHNCLRVLRQIICA